MDYSSIADSSYWTDRATVRNFTIDEVPDDILLPLIDKAAKAPTTGGMQLYSIIITRGEKLKKALDACHFNQPAATGAKVLLTIVADFNRFEKWCLLRGAKPGFGNFESFVAAMLDATIFAQQLNSLLETAGLGVCYLGTTTYTAKAIGEILSLPRLAVPVVTLAVGWPEAEGVATERLPLHSIVHSETYHDYSPEQIEEIFRDKEELETNRKFVEENNVPSLAHVFTDIRYPKANAERFSREFFEYINKAGFVFPEK